MSDERDRADWELMRRHRDRGFAPSVPTADERPSCGAMTFDHEGDYKGTITLRVNDLGRLIIRVKEDPTDPLGKLYLLTLALGA